MSAGTNQVVAIPTGNVPGNYASLGVISGFSTKAAEDLRLFLLGPSGMGKTTFVNSIPKTIILDFEGGSDGMPNPRASRVHIKDMSHFRKVVGVLIADANNPKRPFERFAIDSVDEFAGWVSDEIAEKAGVEVSEMGHGKGWAKLRATVWKYIRNLEMSGYTWVVVGHVTEKTVTSPVTGSETTVLRPVIFESLSQQIMRNSDFFGTIYYESTIEKEMQDVLVAGRTVQKAVTRPVTNYWFNVKSFGNVPGKTRGVVDMPDKVLLPFENGWDAFVAAYKEAEKSGAARCSRKD